MGDPLGHAEGTGEAAESGVFWKNIDAALTGLCCGRSTWQEGFSGL